MADADDITRTALGEIASLEAAANGVCMLILDDTLRGNQRQQRAVDEAIRTVHFIRVPRAAALPWTGGASANTLCRRSAPTWPKTLPLPPGERSLAGWLARGVRLNIAAERSKGPARAGCGCRCNL